MNDDVTRNRRAKGENRVTGEISANKANMAKEVSATFILTVGIGWKRWQPCLELVWSSVRQINFGPNFLHMFSTRSI